MSGRAYRPRAARENPAVTTVLRRKLRLALRADRDPPALALRTRPRAGCRVALEGRARSRPNPPRAGGRRRHAPDGFVRWWLWVQFTAGATHRDVMRRGTP
ncbi:hypothetical protein GCM10009864_79760 [Streptomyces lunalinharesii]|uniref:Uncharacterized protein n=1 Tax=Streptomyces lunalinharesii TaxID=333384 RepID=A0ABN3T473_9ACTN